MGEASGDGRSRRSYLVFFLLAVVLNLWMFRYFLVTLATAASIAVLLSSLLERLSVELKGKRSLAAGLLTALLAMVLLVPVAMYGTILVKQAVDVYDQIRPLLEPAALSDFWTRQLPERFPLVARLQEYFGATSLDGAARPGGPGAFEPGGRTEPDSFNLTLDGTCERDPLPRALSARDVLPPAGRQAFRGRSRSAFSHSPSPSERRCFRASVER